MKDHLHNLLIVVKRHKWGFILPVVLIPMVALVLILQQPHTFQASSEVIFYPSHKDNAPTIGMTLWSTNPQLDGAVAMMDTDMSKKRLEQAYKIFLKVHPEAEAPKGAKGQPAKSTAPGTLRFLYHPNNRFNTITITVSHPNKDLAQFMSNFAANLMVAQYRQLNATSGEGAAVIDEKIHETEQQLAQVEETLKSAQSESEGEDISGKRTMLESQVTTMVSRQSNTSDTVEELAAKRATLLKQLGFRSADEALLLSKLNQNAEIRGLQDALMQARMDLESLSSRYGDSHPKLQQGKYLVQDLQTRLERETRSFLAKQGTSLSKNTASSDLILTPGQLRQVDDLVSTETELRAKRAHYNQIETDLSALQEELASLPKEDMDLSRLQRQHMSLTQELAFLQQQKMSMAWNTTGNDGPMVQVSKAARVKLPGNPFGAIFLALFCAPIVGAVLALSWELLDEHVYNKYDIEKLMQLPIIQEIPLDKSLVLASGRARNDFSDVLGDARGAKKIPLVTEVPGSKVKQDLFHLKSRLSALADGGQKVFSIISPETKSGTTFLVANLAVLSSTSGAKTCVIDANLRNPEIHKLFGLTNEVGLTDLLMGKAQAKDALQLVPRHGSLFVLPAGIAEKDPLFYLEHQRITDLVNSLQKHFDIILFNAPSDMTLMDVPVIANLSQKVLLNIRQEDATVSRLKTWQKQLQMVNRDKIGLIINFATP